MRGEGGRVRGERVRGAGRGMESERGELASKGRES